jgi:hypothetical protein
MFRFFFMLLFLAAVEACGSAKLHPSTAGGVPDFLNAAAPRAELLLIGVFHFQDPGQDAYKPRFALDIMSPKRQREIEEVVEQLVGFHPTRIAVEATADQQPRLDSLYSAYIAGAYHPGANETYQLGFRLAKRLGHSRVYAADAPSRALLTQEQFAGIMTTLHLSIDTVMQQVEKEPWSQRFRQLYAYDDSLKTVQTLSEHLAYLNSAERVRVGHGAYSVGAFKLLGPNAAFLGPDDVTEWYNRNLRIYSNLQHLVQRPTDHLLMIIGAGHLPILRFIAQSSPELRLRDAGEFLHKK